MTVQELYEMMSREMPEELCEPWDNDGLQCSPDVNAPVHRVLITLDVTEDVIDFATDHSFDVIVSHHPLIFHPLSALTDHDPTARKAMRLICAGISVLSFHTRADKTEGGVNDTLAELLGLSRVRPFGEGNLGRIGVLPEPMTMEDFAFRVKESLSSDGVLCADACNDVHTVALVGGEGKDFVSAALAAGADTFLAGRLGYHTMQSAAELGINLVEAGHYHTEQPVTRFFADVISRIGAHVFVQVCDSYSMRLI